MPGFRSPARQLHSHFQSSPSTWRCTSLRLRLPCMCSVLCFLFIFVFACPGFLFFPFLTTTDDDPIHHVQRTICRGSCASNSVEEGCSPRLVFCRVHQGRSQHPGPAPFPREGCKIRHGGRHSCACLSHLPHEVSCFIAPPAFSFGHHNQRTAPRRRELWVVQHDSVPTSAVCGCGCSSFSRHHGG